MNSTGTPLVVDGGTRALTPSAVPPRAELPTLYKRAREALKECAAVDEVKEVHDKHLAIAAYAQQAHDKALLHYAQRVQLRAFERIGELLMQITDYRERNELAAKVGISVVMARRAVESAHIPKRVRDKLIEQNPPPSRSTLAKHGVGYVPKAKAERSGFSRYVRELESRVKFTPADLIVSAMSRISECVEDLERDLGDGVGSRYRLDQLAAAAEPELVPRYRDLISQLSDRLAVLERSLPKAAA